MSDENRSSRNGSKGDEIEPKVSEPMANATQPAAVAEADPADEPLEPSLVFQGFRVRPPNHLSPIASAPRESLQSGPHPLRRGA